MAALIRAIQSPPLRQGRRHRPGSVLPGEGALRAGDAAQQPARVARLRGLDGRRAARHRSGCSTRRDGKPRLSILSIAHLSDAERMFFVTILLNEVLGWMRQQPGTSSLRAILYMDEVFGYFPPIDNPPSKRPMLTLLKQARAFGLGIVLATQNPVDLDYKGLSNCGTWFLGRLQTERDKLRVLDGLEGAVGRRRHELRPGGDGQDAVRPGQSRVPDEQRPRGPPVVFQSRWALSYLRGPLTREQISRLMADRKREAREPQAEPAPARTASEGHGGFAARVAPGNHRAIRSRRRETRKGRLSPGSARPGEAALRASASGIDCWQDVSLLLPVDDALASRDLAKGKSTRRWPGP